MPRKSRNNQPGRGGGRGRGPAETPKTGPATVVRPGARPEKIYPMNIANPALRLYAFLADIFILSAIWLLGSIISQDTVISSQLTAAQNIIIAWTYFILPTGLKGQTAGKWVAGIIVVDEEGRVPGVAMVIPREMVGRVVAIAALGIGLAWILGDKKRQGWHDKIAGTFVVRKADASAPGPFKLLGDRFGGRKKSN